MPVSAQNASVTIWQPGSFQTRVLTLWILAEGRMRGRKNRARWQRREVVGVEEKCETGREAYPHSTVVVDVVVCVVVMLVDGFTVSDQVCSEVFTVWLQQVCVCCMSTCVSSHGLSASWNVRKLAEIQRAVGRQLVHPQNFHCRPVLLRFLLPHRLPLYSLFLYLLIFLSLSLSLSLSVSLFSNLFIQQV